MGKKNEQQETPKPEETQGLEKKISEAEQKALEAEKKLKEANKRAELAEQKTQQAEQRAREAEHKAKEIESQRNQLSLKMDREFAKIFDGSEEEETIYGDETGTVVICKNRIKFKGNYYDPGTHLRVPDGLASILLESKSAVIAESLEAVELKAELQSYKLATSGSLQIVKGYS